MLRSASLILVCSLVACAGDDDSGPDGVNGASGVESSKKLTNLSSSEREQLCDFMVDTWGGAQTKVCSDDISVTTYDVDNCNAAFLTNLDASCEATVRNAESCAKAAGVDVCNLLASPACSFLFICQGEDSGT